MTRPTTADVVAALDKVAPGKTACPGRLARSLGSQQKDLRPVLARLAKAGRIAVTQRGKRCDLATLRGPYRVALLARLGVDDDRHRPVVDERHVHRGGKATGSHRSP